MTTEAERAAEEWMRKALRYLDCVPPTPQREGE